SRGERASEERLVDVAEAYAVLREGGERGGVVPTGVAHFDHARIFDELAQQAIEIFAVQRGIFERHGKLDEQRAQLPFPGKGVEAFAGAGFVVVGGTDAGGGSGLHYGERRVGEGAVKFGGEEEILVYRGDFAAPQLGRLGFQRSVERGVDFSG